MKYTDDGKELGASKIATIMLGWGPFDSPEDLRINAQHAQAGVEVLDTNRWAEASERGNELEISLGEWAVKKLQRMAAGVAITASRPQQGYFKGTTALDKIGSRAFSDHSGSYPELAKKLAHSVGVKSSMISAMASHRSSTVRAAAFLSRALSLAKACSMGLKSGE